MQFLQSHSDQTVPANILYYSALKPNRIIKKFTGINLTVSRFNKKQNKYRLNLGWSCGKEHWVSVYASWCEERRCKSCCSDSVDESSFSVGIPELMVLLSNPTPPLIIWTYVLRCWTRRKSKTRRSTSWRYFILHNIFTIQI